MLNKLCKILFFINLLLLTVQSHAAPPPLSPLLPNVENQKVSSENKPSIFDKIKRLFDKTPKTPLPQTKAETSKPINEDPPKQLSEADDTSEPFIDIGSAKLPSAAGNNLPSNEIVQDSDALKPSNNMNLASNNIRSVKLPVTTNVAQPLVTMPPLKSGSYYVVTPSQQPTQIYKPPSLPTHIPTPLKPPANNDADQGNATSQAPVIVPTAPPPTPSMPPMSTPIVNSPVAPNVTPTNTAPTPTPAMLPAALPPAPNALPPAAPVKPTNSTKQSNSSQETIAASPNTQVKQNWNTPLQPVEVVSASQINSSNAPTQVVNNQVKPQAANSGDINVKKQDDNAVKDMSKSAAKFAKDETQVLFLPNDDIVLGKLTTQAVLDHMDMYAHIKLFQQKEEWVANVDRRKAVESLVKYDNDLNKKKNIYSNLSYCNAVDNAFRAIEKNNLFSLRALLDVYPILQEKGQNGETLLTAATYDDNYYLAKYLVIRGIKISSLNSECQYPLDIALAKGSNNIACMLTKAKGYN